MHCVVELFISSGADLERLFDFLLDQADMTEDLDRAHTAAVMAERRLWESINTINDGFAVFDSSMRLVSANRAWLSSFDDQTVAPGCPYADMVHLIARSGRLDLGDEVPDDFTARMLGRLDADPIEPVTLKFRNGTWIKLQDRRARDGDLVCLGLDITDQMRIWAALEAIPDGFVLYDREERLLTCNQRYRDIYPDSAPAMQPGKRFDDILRYGLANGQHADAVGREEEWLAERIGQYRAGGGTFEQQLSDGRWVRAHDHVTPDGGEVDVPPELCDLGPVLLTPSGVQQRMETLMAGASQALLVLLDVASLHGLGERDALQQVALRLAATDQLP